MAMDIMEDTDIIIIIITTIMDMSILEVPEDLLEHIVHLA
jgi:hypothetical protein